MKKLLFGTLLFLFTTLSVFSQAVSALPADQTFLADYVSKIWTTEDGLPGMSVTTVLQDQRGYIWIGTYDGLVRFDGVEFITYSRTTDSRFDFASARSLFQSKDGTLWVGHNDEGVTAINSDGQIRKFTMDNGLPNNKINSINEDHNHNVWIGTSSGVCYITPEFEIKIPDGLKELDQEKILVNMIYCDLAGRIWICTGLENDLFVYENNKS